MSNVLAWIMAAIIFGFGLVFLVQCLDGISRYNAERELCLKRATNGYEIERCR